MAKKAAKKTATKKSPSKKPTPRKTASKSTKKSAAKKKSSSGCYFTTACVRYYGLADNCYQLTTLRNFRDSVLMKDDAALVSHYYEVAPKIIKKLHTSKTKKEEYKKIYSHINDACELIELNRLAEAKACYISMVNYLSKKYL